MAKCNNCGVGISSAKYIENNGFCLSCLEFPDSKKSNFTQIVPINIHSIWNGYSILGWIFILLSLFIGDLVNYYEFNRNPLQQIALTLSFGFIGISLIVTGIAITLLNVMKNKN